MAWWQYDYANAKFKYSTDDGASFITPPLDASIITQGVFNAARLPVATQTAAGIVDTNPQNIAGTKYFWNGMSIEGGALTVRPGSESAFYDYLRLYNKGIVFQPTSFNDPYANTLDCYIEGSWTPILRGDGGGTGPTYSHNYGQYVKIGRAVIIVGSMWLSNKGNMTGAFLIDGLPFTSQGNSYQAIAIRMYPINSLGGLNYIPIWTISPGTPYGYINLFRADGTGSTGINISHLDNATVIMFSGVYISLN